MTGITGNSGTKSFSKGPEVEQNPGMEDFLLGIKEAAEKKKKLEQELFRSY